MAITENQKKYLTNIVNGQDEKGNVTNEGQKAWAKAELQKAKEYTPSGTHNDVTTKNYNDVDYKTINAYKQAYDSAKANGDSAGMTTAHNKAEEIRNKYGYSGGSDGSQYIYKSQNKVNPYDSYMSKIEQDYNNFNKNIVERNNLAVNQGINRLENQKLNINKSAEDNARQAYVLYMQNKKTLPQQLASQGLTGGATETANLGISSNYQNNINMINQNKANSIKDIDNAIIDFKNSGDLAVAEQVLSNNQQALNAYQQAFSQKQGYNQWLKNYDLNKSQIDYNTGYQERAFQKDVEQRTLENTRYDEEIAYQKELQDQQKVISLMSAGVYDANTIANTIGTTPELAQTYIDRINSEYQANDSIRQLEIEGLGLSNASTKAQIANIYSNISNRGSSSSGSKSSSSSNSSESKSNQTYTQILSGIQNILKNKDYEDYIKNNEGAKYLVNSDISDFDAISVMKQSGLPLSAVVLEKKKQGYDDQYIMNFANAFYNGNLSDDYAKKIFDYINK